MKAVVVYESLWGNTAAVARAIAEGLGPGATVMSTADADPSTMQDVDLIVAGAPVHLRGLPSDKSRATALERAENGIEPVPVIEAPGMAEWLDRLPKARGNAAAFDTGNDAWWGGGTASKIARGLRRAGLRQVVKPESFFVEDARDGKGPFLTEGQLERARSWGAEIAAKLGGEERS